MIKAVLFDIGHTLEDHRKSNKKFIHLCIELSILDERKSRRILRELVRKKRAKNPYIVLGHSDGFRRDVAEALGIPYEKLTQEFSRTYEKEARLMPGALFMLKELKKEGIKIGAIANASRRFTEIFFKRFGLEKYFDCIVLSDETGARKPSPLIFRKALDELNVKPSEAVMVGNRLDNDVVPAKKLGMQTVLVAGGPQTRKGVKPNRIIHCLRELLEYV
ncbi:HAD family hydrolase [Candidatus Micrarchaeota archaeon]|nr:HAD family hydrolase [Candidatus Micrarchaeota archaeon]